MEKLKVGVLISGGGTNMQAIINACLSDEIPAEIVAVISNNSNAFGLERAKKAGIPGYHISNTHYPNDADLDKAIASKLKEHGAELVCLAGYMKKRGSAFLDVFKNRVINIHPGPLPEYGGKGFYGLNVHHAVIEAGEEFSGPTVHLVDEEYDHGPPVGHIKVPVLPDDTPESLAERVLEKEHKLYPDVIGAIARKELDLDEIAGKA